MRASSQRRPASRAFLWIATFLFGLLAVMIINLAGARGMYLLLLVVPIVVYGAGLEGLSGVMTGFGALWLTLIARQLASEAELDDAGFWLAVGVVPLGIGLVLAVLLVARRRSGPLTDG